MLPAQIKPQRSVGNGALIARHALGRTRLDDLFQQGCAKIRLPATYSKDSLEAVMINTSGGITGGDALDWRFSAGADCNLTVTSQACERIYKSVGGHATVNVDLKVASGAKLQWLPQETILFDGGAVRRNINVSLDDDASLLMVEPLVFGRKTMLETVQSGYFKDRWRIHHNGRLIHREEALFENDIAAAMTQKAVTDGNIAMVTVLKIETGETQLTPAMIAKTRSILGTSGGFSQWSVGNATKSMARIVAEDSYALRKILLPLIAMHNEGATIPKCWSL